MRRITSRCSSEIWARARSRSRNDSPAAGSDAVVGPGHVPSKSTAMPSRTRLRTPFTFWLCIIVKSQARRLVPHCEQCCLAIARTRVSWTRSSVTCCGPMQKHSPAVAGFLFREVDRNRSSYPPMFSTKCQPGVAPQREWHGRHLDYGEAQSFQDLLFCRSLRLIGNELHARLARSPWISVQDLQTHSATLRRRRLLNLPASFDHE
jgi:hypothetical protein